MEIRIGILDLSAYIPIGKKKPEKKRNSATSGKDTSDAQTFGRVMCVCVRLQGPPQHTHTHTTPPVLSFLNRFPCSIF